MTLLGSGGPGTRKSATHPLVGAPRHRLAGPGLADQHHAMAGLLSLVGLDALVDGVRQNLQPLVQQLLLQRRLGKQWVCRRTAKGGLTERPPKWAPQGQLWAGPNNRVPGTTCMQGGKAWWGWVDLPSRSEFRTPALCSDPPPPTPRSRLRGTHFWGVNFGIKKTWCYLSPIPPPGGRTHPPTPLSRVTKLQKKNSAPPHPPWKFTKKNSLGAGGRKFVLNWRLEIQEGVEGGRPHPPPIISGIPIQPCMTALDPQKNNTTQFLLERFDT